MRNAVNKTIYRAIFNFGLPKQNKILKEMYTHGYHLIGYKGATGTNQISEGLPTWFSRSFMELLNTNEIIHEPVYKVYVYEENDMNQYVQIKMDYLSEECDLGSSVSFNSQGEFSIQKDSAPEGCIQLIDNRPSGSKRIIVGLASKIMDQFSPFCAFSSSKEIITMEPNNKICLYTAQTSLIEGTIIRNLLGMGSSFEFDSNNNQYELELTRMPWGIAQTDYNEKINIQFPNQDLSHILNTNFSDLDFEYKQTDQMIMS